MICRQVPVYSIAFRKYKRPFIHRTKKQNARNSHKAG